MTEPTASDAELEQALEQARTRHANGPGLTAGTLALAGLVLAGGGFLGGYLVGDNGAGPDDGPGGMVVRGEGPGGGPMGGPANLTIGTIESISGDTFTVKTDAGDTVKVQVVDDTSIRINKEGTVKDLTEGDDVVVNGQRDGDTIEAENIGSGMMVHRVGGPSGAGG